MNSKKSRYVIGGDFELHLPNFVGTDNLSKLTFGLTGTWTTSGRDALMLLLRHLKAIGVKHVHLPSYLCQSILLPVQKMGLNYSFYRVDKTLAAHPDPPSGAAVILIHYFGYKNPSTEMLRTKAGKSFYLIEDATQSPLSNIGFVPSGANFVFSSFRKLGPTLLGGWCNISVKLDDPLLEIEALIWRLLAVRLLRGAYLAEPGAPIDSALEDFYLKAFREIEQYLDTHLTCSPLPQIALGIIAGIDWENISRKRRTNWQFLNELLRDDVEALMHELPNDVVPIGYVVQLKNRDQVRARLADQRFFCPVNWPLPSEVNAESFPEAMSLSQTSLIIPVDQRYGYSDMVKIANALKALV